MAWKLKKWKGSEAEEEQAPEDGYDITDAATPQEEYAAPQPPAFAQPEPAQAFNSNDLSQELFAQQGPAEAIATPPPSAPSVIPLGPADLEAEVAPPPIDTSAEDAPEPVQAAPVHELDSEVETSPSPIDFSPQADQEIDSESPDYFAQSVASAHEAVTQFEQISSEPAMQEEDEPIAFELDTPGQALSGLHAQPTLVEPEDIAPAPPPAPQAPPPPASANTLDAFAPYQPAATAAVDNGRGGAPAPSVPLSAPGFEDALSFAPLASGRLIVKIGPFTANYEIDKPEITIGRPDPKVNNSPDIGLEWDDAVSRHHARIMRANSGDYIEDVGSSNGTMLNGQPIAVNTPILLKNGDIITIGERTQITYQK